MKELKPFEDDVLELISNIKYKKVNNPFQNQLKNDCQSIFEATEIITKADKSQNLYKVPITDYKQTLQKEITKNYKKCKHELVTETNREAARIAKSLELEDRIEMMSENEAFFTIKDHKEAFPGKIENRLINPSKSKIGIVSKQILEDINQKVRISSNNNQWRNTQAVINWFENIENKEKYSFFKFDIVNFYPSISKKLLIDSIEYAKTFTSIDRTRDRGNDFSIHWQIIKSVPSYNPNIQTCHLCNMEKTIILTST